MSEKVRNYEKESIEVCRNCKGTGIAYTVPEFHPYGREDDPQPYECPVCRGSGRVKKDAEHRDHDRTLPRQVRGIKKKPANREPTNERSVGTLLQK